MPCQGDDAKERASPVPANKSHTSNPVTRSLLLRHFRGRSGTKTQPLTMSDIKDEATDDEQVCSDRKPF